MATAAKTGRDKLTLILPPSLEEFGLWVEQLVAESTGKRGVGIVPIAGETLGGPDKYREDRLFVRLRTTAEKDEAARDRAVALLSDAPLATITFEEPAALGAEFMRWEIATAVAGGLLEINPFDEPNVQQAKDATRGLLDRYEIDRRLPTGPTDYTSEDGTTLTLTTAARSRLGRHGTHDILTLLGSATTWRSSPSSDPIPSLPRAAGVSHGGSRHARAATMFGYGPRYLHSTGQLHKGGPNSGVFVLITATASEDIAIPDESFSFGTLELAQGLGDFASLEATGRRAIHVHLPSPDPRRLERTLARFTQALHH
jgi:hypothetical protein